MLSSVFGKTLWDNRRAVWWWGGGVAALAAMMVAFWPAVQDMAQFSELLEAYPEAMLALFGIEAEEFTTAAGFLTGELYSAMLPIIFLIFAIQRGASATAGAEQDGTMDLTLSAPVRRRRVVLDAFLAMAALTTGLAAVLVVVLLGGGALVDLGLSVQGVLAANLGLVLLALLFGALALAVGAWTGRRVLAAGASTAVAVAAFFVNGLAPMVEALETPQQASPFHWLLDGKPLANGFDWPGLALLTVTTIVLVGVAVWGFERRDIAT
jgi:ABC-2 type transport system permease protein